jgi:hypothetical protein
MKKLKKFKRFSEGGLGSSMGAGTPNFAVSSIETDEGYKREKEQGAKNLEDIKNFFMGRRSKDEPSASIEERKPPKAEKDTGEAKTPATAPAKPAETAPVVKPSVQSMAVNRGETSYDYPTQRESKRDDYEGGASPTSGGQTFKPSARPPVAPTNKPKPKPPAPAAEKTPAASSKPSYVGAGDSDDSVETKKKNELERLQRVGSGAVEQTMQGPLEAGLFGLMGGIPSKVRAGIGLAKKGYEELTKPAAKPAEKSEPTLSSSTPASSTPPKEPRTLVDPRAAANRRAAESGTKEAPKEAPKEPRTLVDPRAAANRRAAESGTKETPKPAPKAEPKAETKSGAIQPTGKGPSEAGKNLMEKGRGSLKDQAMEAVNKQRAATKDPRGAVRPEPKTIKPTGKGVSKAGKELMDRANNRSSTILEKERKPDLAMQEYISGRETARNRVKDLSDDGLSVERYANKKGGKIPAFKKGGLVSRGDGCAVRGKTKGRMV